MPMQDWISYLNAQWMNMTDTWSKCVCGTGLQGRCTHAQGSRVLLLKPAHGQRGCGNAQTGLWSTDEAEVTANPEGSKPEAEGGRDWVHHHWTICMRCGCTCPRARPAAIPRTQRSGVTSGGRQTYGRIPAQPSSHVTCGGFWISV